MKKKKEEPEQGQPPIAPDLTPSPEIVENEIYSIGQWNGLAQWRCKYCAWDTLDGEQAVIQHYLDRHVHRMPVRSHGIIVYDRRGKPAN